MSHAKHGGGSWRPARPSETTQDQSWGDSVRRYKTEKETAPSMQASDHVPHRLYRDSRFSQKAEERAYDVMAAEFRDPAREEDLQQRELNLKLERMNRAKDLALRYESPYDVINQEPKLMSDGKEMVPDKPKTPPAAAPPPWNKHQPKKHGLKDFYWPHTRESEYHIINNRYLDRDHDAYMAKQHAEDSSGSAAKFFKANHYNPVNGVFFDPSMEQEYQNQRNVEATTHGQDKFNRLPISVKKGEGMSYDILAPNIVYNHRRIAQQEEDEQNASAFPRLAHSHEKFVLERRDYLAAREAQRKMNRIVDKSTDTTIARGYDILTNVPVKGRLGRPPPGAGHRVQRELKRPTRQTQQVAVPAPGATPDNIPDSLDTYTQQQQATQKQPAVSACS